MGEGIQIGDYVLQPSSYTELRAEAAMPGTAAIRRELELIQPPPPEVAPVPEAERDYGPDPIAEYSLRFDARATFTCADLASALHKIRWPRHLDRPSYYVATPGGHITYLQSSDAPTEGVALIAAWRLGDMIMPEIIAASADKLSAWLAKRGFSSAAASIPEIEALQEMAGEIIDITPENVECICYLAENAAPLDGKLVWNVLHSMGFRWGDMDCFQWEDETGQTDYLVWAEVHDGRYGYAIPEYIAAGSQNFHAVSFSFRPCRSPAPVHVLGEMLRAAGFFQKQTGCLVAARIDGEIVDGAEDLFHAVSAIEAKLKALGVKPGSGSVCRLR